MKGKVMYIMINIFIGIIMGIFLAVFIIDSDNNDIIPKEALDEVCYELYGYGYEYYDSERPGVEHKLHCKNTKISVIAKKESYIVDVTYGDY